MRIWRSALNSASGAFLGVVSLDFSLTRGLQLARQHLSNFKKRWSRYGLAIFYLRICFSSSAVTATRPQKNTCYHLTRAEVKLQYSCVCHGGKENSTSLRHTRWKKGVNGGAKCCGAVCPHIIIQVAVLASDLGKRREERQMGLGVLDIFLVLFVATLIYCVMIFVRIKAFVCNVLLK